MCKDWTVLRPEFHLRASQHESRGKPQVVKEIVAALVMGDLIKTSNGRQTKIVISIGAYISSPSLSASLLGSKARRCQACAERAISWMWTRSRTRSRHGQQGQKGIVFIATELDSEQRDYKQKMEVGRRQV